MAVDSELAGTPAVAGPLIVPLTLLYCEVVAPEFTVVLTINHIWQDSNSRVEVLLFRIVRAHTPVVSIQETTCADGFPDTPMVIGEEELVVLMVLVLLTGVPVANSVWVTVTVLGPFGSAVVASRPTARAAATAMVTAMLISLLYSANSNYLSYTYGRYAIHCYALGSAQSPLLMCSNISPTDYTYLEPYLD